MPLPELPEPFAQISSQRVLVNTDADLARIAGFEVHEVYSAEQVKALMRQAREEALREAANVVLHLSSRPAP